jgi:hypothetical protein
VVIVFCSKECAKAFYLAVLADSIIAGDDPSLLAGDDLRHMGQHDPNRHPATLGSPASWDGGLGFMLSSQTCADLLAAAHRRGPPALDRSLKPGPSSAAPGEDNVATRQALTPENHCTCFVPDTQVLGDLVGLSAWKTG